MLETVQKLLKVSELVLREQGETRSAALLFLTFYSVRL